MSLKRGIGRSRQSGERLDRRRADERAGRAAESIAAFLLRLKGYRIVARRFRGIRGEVDLIAQKLGVLAFVEVKRRADLAAALESVSPRQRARVAAAAEEFVARNPQFAASAIRFDAVAIAPGRFPRHVKDAWRPS
jgi:putative endonuclease